MVNTGLVLHYFHAKVHALFTIPGSKLYIGILSAAKSVLALQPTCVCPLFFGKFAVNRNSVVQIGYDADGISKLVFALALPCVGGLTVFTENTYFRNSYILLSFGYAERHTHFLDKGVVELRNCSGTASDVHQFAGVLACKVHIATVKLHIVDCLNLAVGADQFHEIHLTERALFQRRVVHQHGTRGNRIVETESKGCLLRYFGFLYVTHKGFVCRFVYRQKSVVYRFCIDFGVGNTHFGILDDVAVFAVCLGQGLHRIGRTVCVRHVEIVTVLVLDRYPLVFVYCRVSCVTTLGVVVVAVIYNEVLSALTDKGMVSCAGYRCAFGGHGAQQQCAFFRAKFAVGTEYVVGNCSSYAVVTLSVTVD